MSLEQSWNYYSLTNSFYIIFIYSKNYYSKDNDRLVRESNLAMEEAKGWNEVSVIPMHLYKLNRYLLSEYEI